MSDKIKFTDEELNKLKSLQDRFNNVILQFGQVDIEIIKSKDDLKKLENIKEQLEVDYSRLRAEEVALAEELTKKYGGGMLNPATGDFTPEPNPTVLTS